MLLIADPLLYKQKKALEKRGPFSLQRYGKEIIPAREPVRSCAGGT